MVKTEQQIQDRQQTVSNANRSVRTIRASPRAKQIIAPRHGWGYLSSSHSLKRFSNLSHSGTHSPSKNFLSIKFLQWKNNPTSLLVTSMPSFTLVTMSFPNEMTLSNEFVLAILDSDIDPSNHLVLNNANKISRVPARLVMYQSTVRTVQMIVHILSSPKL